MDAANETLDTLRMRGAVKIPGAINAALARDLRQEVESRYALDATDFELLNGYSGGHIRPPVDPLLEALRATAVPAIAREFLDTDRIAVPINHLIWRKRFDAVDAAGERNTSRHFFHQDCGLIPEHFPLNAWVALSKVDGDCHGLSFALPAPEGPTPLAIEPERYVAETGGEIWTPELEPGDLLLFHRFTIHGSWMTRGKPNTRYSVEFRIGAASAAPVGYADVLWHLTDAP